MVAAIPEDTVAAAVELLFAARRASFISGCGAGVSVRPLTRPPGRAPGAAAC
jgi:hypothetical protein